MADRRARSGDGCGRRSAHPPWHARGCGPQAIGGSPAADRRFRPSQRGCRSQWRGLPTGKRDTGSADALITALVIASSCRTRNSDRRELLMARTRKATEATNRSARGHAGDCNSPASATSSTTCSTRRRTRTCRRVRRADTAVRARDRAQGFPAVKELAAFDFEAPPSIDPKQIRDLAASRWIANSENVLLGPGRRQDALVDRARARGDPGRLYGAVHHGNDAGRWPRQGAWPAAPGRKTTRAGEAKAADRRRTRLPARWNPMRRICSSSWSAAATK